MKVTWAAMLMLLMTAAGWAQTYQNQVWGSGNMIFGQATLTDIRMATHQLTTKVRFVNQTTGVAGPWITKITSGSAPNVNRISQLRPNAPYQYAFEVEYKVFCPNGRYNSEESRSMLFLVGYTLNCLHLVTGTAQRNAYGDWYALYSKTPYCGGRCLVEDRIGFTTAGSKVGPDLYVSMRYWWVELLGGLVGKWCLDAYEANRLPCSSCGDYAR